MPNLNSQPKAHHPENTPNSLVQGADRTPALQVETLIAHRRNMVVGRYSIPAQKAGCRPESSTNTEMAAGIVPF
jgi:hypothetical protein